MKCFAEIPDSSEKLRYKLIANELVMVDSPYFVHMRFIEDEIQAEISYPEDRLPVLLMDWVEGEILAEYLAANYQYTFSMSILCYRFCKMASWLHIQDFAHGDITPPQVSESAFEDIYQSAKLYVPKGSRSKYAEVSVWKHFSNIEENEASGISNIDAAVQTGLVSIYTLDGTPIYRGTTSVNVHQVLPKGTYIVKQGSGTKKIIVK